MTEFFNTKIEFLKGVGPQRSALLNKELEIFTFGDLIQHYPFRYEDRTKYYKINELNPDMPFVQFKGTLRHMELVGSPRRKRLVAYIFDDTGEIELIWFKGGNWILKKLKPGIEYVVFGKPSLFGQRINIAHPEIDAHIESGEKKPYLHPVYPTTEKLKTRFLDSKGISRLQKTLIKEALSHITETLPDNILQKFSLFTKTKALINIHFPENHQNLSKAQFRLKFEEFFYVQLRLLKLKLTRMEKYAGLSFNDTSLLTEFYKKYLPFTLTEAQKRVLREIYGDLKSGKQMNRLLQGDVGSGKTMVAFISMLVPIISGAQAAMMAPTEILAEQHFNSLKSFAQKLNIEISLLTGSTKKRTREEILDGIRDGQIKILVGTHALIEDEVRFKNLGLAIIDEQQRFGVAQRAKLWQKTDSSYPHVLVMTATPIPRTLAMTLYGDLDVSVIDELPAGRKAIKTIHQYDSHRLKLFGFVREQINLGHQVYFVYPLIEESEKLDLKHLEDGYESIKRAFPEFHVSILHGRMKSQAKEFEMQRFVNGETHIMVSTTVIEVGVDVPNASVMVIENAERFGLAQLHQLRGRVGRGAAQSFCILMSKFELTREARTRLETMVRTNNGFEIADMDLQLRGPGDLMGTQQSGALDLLIGDLGKDGKILQVAREEAKTLLASDPELNEPANLSIRKHIDSLSSSVVNWSRIS
ncbi:ATP-dependent DNA helicase RecG [Bacteroidota bacterium]